jgi:hypothetical protein
MFKASKGLFGAAGGEIRRNISIFLENFATSFTLGFDKAKFTSLNLQIY